MNTNFTKQSIYIKNPKRVNQEINDIINFTVWSLGKSQLCVNLYISGSLARQEPTVRIVDGEERLNSDLDFVIVHKENRENQNVIFDIVWKIKNQYKDYDCSFVVLNEEQLLKVNSLFARDLSLGMRNPLYKSFEEQKLEEVIITEKNYLESVITQMCCYLLNPDLTMSQSENKYFKNSDYHYTKLVMECIRAIHYKNVNVIGYNTLFNATCKSLDEKEIKSCIKARELSDITYMPVVDINELLEETFAVLFKEQNYISLIINELIFSETNDIILFQYAMIIFWKSWSEARYFKDTLVILKKIGFVVPFVNEISEIFEIYLSTKNNLTKEKVILSIRKIRNLYVELLHQQNTKETFFIDRILQNRIK